MKFGVRKRSIKKSISARTTGKWKRQVKRAINPLYGKKGMGWIHNPKKAAYNKIYNKTTVDSRELFGAASALVTGSSGKKRKTAVKRTEYVPVNTGSRSRGWLYRLGMWVQLALGGLFFLCAVVNLSSGYDISTDIVMLIIGIICLWFGLRRKKVLNEGNSIAAEETGTGDSQSMTSMDDEGSDGNPGSAAKVSRTIVCAHCGAPNTVTEGEDKVCCYCGMTLE